MSSEAKDSEKNELQQEEIQEIIREIQKIKQENQDLKKEIDKIRNRQKTTKKPINRQPTNISRREFLKKAGLGTIGIGALLSPVSALNVKADHFSVSTSDNSNTLNEGLKIDSNHNLIVPNGSIGIGIENPTLPLEIGGSQGIRIPIGNNEDRSNNPKEGEFRGNSETEVIESYYDGSWNVIGSIFTPIDAEGGTTIIESNIEGILYRIHAFEEVGETEFTVNDIGSEGMIDVLVVGGGGGGVEDGSGSGAGGGGGAGGVVYKEGISASDRAYNIMVGQGGNGADRAVGENGGNSYFDEDRSEELVALGGGGGAGGTGGDEYDGTSDSANEGGCGGGDGGGHNGGGNSDGANGIQSGTNPEADIDSGNDGAGYNGGYYGGCGGGGAGKSPLNSQDQYHSTNGGDGIDLSHIFGTEFGENGVFGGGGAGSAGGAGGGSPGDIAKGGLGGGGDGGYAHTIEPPGVGENGGPVPNSGGGGGSWGGNGGGGTGGSGGASGIVLIRYPLEKP